MRGRPLRIDWKESPDVLEARYQCERNGHRRDRLNALMYLSKGHQLGDVARIVGVDYRTIQRWIAWYRLDGLDSMLERTPGHAAPGRPSRLQPEQLQHLIEAADTGCFRTVWDAVHWVEETYGVSYTYTGMHALLKRHQLGVV